MRLIYLLAFGLIIQSCATTNTIVETGRPKDFITNNAQEIAGKEFGIEYAYVAFKSPSQIDSINRINQESYKNLSKEHGDNWRNNLNKQIEVETKNLNAYLSVLKANNIITDDNYVYFIKLKKKGVYIAQIYPEIEPENKSAESLIRTVEIREGGEVNEVELIYLD